MRYSQHRYVFLFAALAFGVVYGLLRGFTFNIDAAVCVSFTILVFGNAIRKRGRQLFSGDQARPLAENLLAHVICLIALVMILRTGMYAASLPNWLIIPVGADNYGRLGPSAFQMLQGLAVFFLGFLEWHLLTAARRVDPEKQEAKARIALWKKGELDAERMDSLRLP
jgi:hypothetical protein